MPPKRARAADTMIRVMFDGSAHHMLVSGRWTAGELCARLAPKINLAADAMVLFMERVKLHNGRSLATQGVRHLSSLVCEQRELGERDGAVAKAARTVKAEAARARAQRDLEKNAAAVRSDEPRPPHAPLAQREAHTCLLCHAACADTYPLRTDGAPCWRSNADPDARHWYCRGCLVGLMHTNGPVCVAPGCNMPFEQTYTVDVGPSPVPEELRGERCVVCNGAHAYATNELIVCGCATCADADPIFRKAVHLGCTGCDGYGKVWRKVPTGQMYFENVSTGESHVPSDGLRRDDRVFAFYDFHRDAGSSAADDDDDTEGVLDADSDYDYVPSDSETEPAEGIESDADEANETSDAGSSTSAASSASVASSASAASTGGAAPVAVGNLGGPGERAEGGRCSGRRGGDCHGAR